MDYNNTIAGVIKKYKNIALFTVPLLLLLNQGCKGQHHDLVIPHTDTEEDIGISCQTETSDFHVSSPIESAHTVCPDIIGSGENFTHEKIASYNYKQRLDSLQGIFGGERSFDEAINTTHQSIQIYNDRKEAENTYLNNPTSENDIRAQESKLIFEKNFLKIVKLADELDISAFLFGTYENLFKDRFPALSQALASVDQENIANRIVTDTNLRKLMQEAYRTHDVAYKNMIDKIGTSTQKADESYNQANGILLNGGINKETYIGTSGEILPIYQTNYVDITIHRNREGFPVEEIIERVEFNNATISEICQREQYGPIQIQDLFITVTKSNCSGGHLGMSVFIGTADGSKILGKDGKEADILIKLNTNCTSLYNGEGDQNSSMYYTSSLHNVDYQSGQGNVGAQTNLGNSSSENYDIMLKGEK